MARELVVRAPGSLVVRKLVWNQEKRMLHLLFQADMPTPLFSIRCWRGLKAVRLVGFRFRWEITGTIEIEMEDGLFLLSAPADSNESDVVFEQPHWLLEDVKFVW